MMSYLVRRENFANGTPPPKKPYSAVEFKNSTDTLLQGVYGTGKSSNAFLVDLMQKELDKAVTEGVVTMEEGLEFIKSRKKYYDDYLKEKSKTTDGPIGLPQIEERTELQGGTDPETGMGFQKGNPGFRTKDGEVRNVKGSNQFTPKTTAQIQAIINKPEYKGYTPTRFEKENILTRTDTKNKDVVFQKKGITPADPEKQKTQKAITSKKRLERLKKISNPNIEKKIAGKGGLNLSHIGQYNTPVTLSNLAYLPADVNIKSYENFEKKIQNNFNKILTVYRNEKLKPEVKTEKIAALMKEDRQLRSDNPKYANIKSRMSIRRTALDPSGIMIKEKIRDPKMTIGKGEAGLNLKEARPRSPERRGILNIAQKALQSLKTKGAPGLGSGEFKDPLGGQIDLIDVRNIIRRPDNV